MLSIDSNSAITNITAAKINISNADMFSLGLLDCELKVAYCSCCGFITSVSADQNRWQTYTEYTDTAIRIIEPTLSGLNKP